MLTNFNLSRNFYNILRIYKQEKLGFHKPPINKKDAFVWSGKLNKLMKTKMQKQENVHPTSFSLITNDINTLLCSMEVGEYRKPSTEEFFHAI